MTQRPGDRLIQRLRTENGLEVPEGTHVRRTYAGRAQREAGAWVWRLHLPDGRWVQPMVGSQWPVTDLLKFPRLVISRDTSHSWSEAAADRHVDPDATGAEIREILRRTP